MSSQDLSGDSLQKKNLTALQNLLNIMEKLRDPISGCAWDREQTLASILPHALEEAYEVAEAIAVGEPLAIRDELGDLLFQVVFLSRIAEEQNWFSFDDVAEAIVSKLVRRHPHVFATTKALSSLEQTQAWEKFKAREREVAGQGGVLAGIALALPALTRATKLGKRAAQVGFDWPDSAGVRAKINEELAEFEAAVADSESAQRQIEEFGDVLFSFVNWARHLKIDPEAALRVANVKFEKRFAHMERIALARGIALESIGLPAWETLWLEAKAAHHGCLD